MVALVINQEQSTPRTSLAVTKQERYTFSQYFFKQ